MYLPGLTTDKRVYQYLCIKIHMKWVSVTRTDTGGVQKFHRTLLNRKWKLRYSWVLRNNTISPLSSNKDEYDEKDKKKKTPPPSKKIRTVGIIEGWHWKCLLRLRDPEWTGPKIESLQENSEEENLFFHLNSCRTEIKIF